MLIDAKNVFSPYVFLNGMMCPCFFRQRIHVNTMSHTDLEVRLEEKQYGHFKIKTRQGKVNSQAQECRRANHGLIKRKAVLDWNKQPMSKVFIAKCIKNHLKRERNFNKSER